MRSSLVWRIQAQSSVRYSRAGASGKTVSGKAIVMKVLQEDRSTAAGVYLLRDIVSGQEFTASSSEVSYKELKPSVKNKKSGN